MSEKINFAFEFKNVTKHFGNVTANADVSFSVSKNTIHGVVGENGAGKSTIMKTLYGLYQPDAGEIWVNGECKAVVNPHVAIALGIGMVHQHFMLVPTLTVYQNIILGKEPSLFRPNDKNTRRQIDELQNNFGFRLALDTKIEDLSVGQQQQVEILKQLYRQADILILDEPTAVLTPQEVDALFERLRALRDRNKTIVLISHKLKEILSLTQFVTVMRQGRVVTSIPTAAVTENSLAELIIGRKKRDLPARLASRSDDEVIQVRDLCLKSSHGPGLNQVNFNLKKGEIVGLAGVSGNGQEDLIDVLASVTRHYSGTVLFNQRNYRSLKTYAAKQTGLAVIPPDRHREGVILDFSVFENFLLGHHKEARFSNAGWISKKKLSDQAALLMEHYDVRPRDGSLPMRGLSGGNQQKAVIAREMSWGAQFIIAAYPTRGVDIGAIEFIHSLFLAEREKGAAILLVSSELDEILALSDRILVMFNGRIVGEVPGSAAVESQLGLWMTGVGTGH